MHQLYLGSLEDEKIEGMFAQAISSLMDTWINLRFFENNNERTCNISIIKYRGMPQSDQIKEYQLIDHGVEIKDVYLGPSGDLLMGLARAA